MSFSWTQHRFSGGALALDVANSVVLRVDPALSIDRFAEVKQLEAFPAAAETFSAERSLFGTILPVGTENRTAFIQLREAIDAYFRARVEASDTPQLLARLLETTAAVLRIGPRGSLEAETAYSALRLLAEGESERIRICGNCGWLFVDRSRNRSRIWCDMSVCGNRVKAARHYSHRKERSS
jgi:predicted RNA-binding Zn ribbon-like protein